VRLDRLSRSFWHRGFSAAREAGGQAAIDAYRDTAYLPLGQLNSFCRTI
jgi:hypothetical protein